jgi:transcriptional regulator with XRE-family HTH domain
VDDATAGRSVRLVRIRLKLTQRQLAAAADVSQSTVSRIERGHLDSISLRALRAVTKRLDIRAQVVLRWRGGELDRLLARRHSAMHESLAQMFAALPEWEFAPEVTYSMWGERGTIDILAWHPRRRMLLVIEIKTELVDVQELVGRLDQKVRLAPQIARDRGWDAALVSAWVVFAPSRTTERRLQEHATMLRRVFPVDGRTIRRWLRDPSQKISALSFAPASQAGDGGRGQAPIKRVSSKRPRTPPA